MKLIPLPLRPAGKTVAFVCTATGGGLAEVDHYEGTEEGDQLRAQRVAVGLGLREAARRVGLSVVDLLRLETGRATLSPENWRALLEKMGAAS